MEGAAFFYISLLKKIPFLSIRSISNLVEARDTSKWDFKNAIENLNSTIIELLEKSKFHPEIQCNLGFAQEKREGVMRKGNIML